MRIKHVVTALFLFFVPTLALAITVLDSNSVPEPETLALLAAGAVAWGIARWTKRK